MRNDDLSQPQERSHKVRCYNCQREAQRQVKTFYGSKPNEKYNGNLEIKKEIPRQSSEGKVFYVTECYTGKYVMKFGNFCSVKCGLIWANSEIQRRRDARNPKNFGSGSSIDEDTKGKLEEMRVRMFRKMNYGE
tara:strand:- start:391 stop:792 length:402 start_codon:yes stop_codon:yes gene_type:complete